MWSPATQHARGERRPRGNSTLPVSQHLSANVELHILRRSRLRAAESRRSRGAVHVAGRALRAALGDGDPATWCSASGTGSSTTRWPPPRRSTAWYTTRWCLSSTCRAIERTRCDRRHRHRLHRRRLVDGHGVRCCRGATDPLLPETCVVQDIGELAVLPAFRWRPKAPAAFRQSSRRCGAERRIRARPSVNAHPDVVRARERRLQARLAQQPPPIVPTVVACARRAFRGTRVVARRNALSGSSSSITPSGPTRPFRLARVPRPGMTNTDVRLGTQPGDRTRQGPRYARNITSRTLSRTNAHAYIDADVPAAPRSSTPGGSGRGTVPRVAGRVAGIARRVRDRGVARAGLRSGSAGTGDCRSDQRLRA